MVTESIIKIGMSEYRKRIADKILKYRLEETGAVLIEGPKWCGKTTTAEHQAKSILYMDNPAKKAQNLEMAKINPQRLLRGNTPRLIDEWQLAPSLWDTVRFEVDHRKKEAQFTLTGSAVPPDEKSGEHPDHTGTGRFSWIFMRPMSLWESGESNGQVSLADLFAGNLDIDGENDKTLDDIAFFTCRGGWPGTIDKNKRASLHLAFDYYDAIVNQDISRADGVERDRERTKLLIKSYARNQGSQASIHNITQDIAANDESDLAEKTSISYIKALKKIFVIEDMPAWNPNLRSKTAIRTSDTRYFVDPSIAVASLGLGPEDLINNLQTFGLFFETMCIRDLRVYADSLEGSVYHYRDKSELECDAVIHLRNGNYGLIEIKLGGDTLINVGARTLKKLAEKIDTTKMKAPSFLMILTAVGDYAYKREDGILIVPICCLKD